MDDDEDIIFINLINNSDVQVVETKSHNYDIPVTNVDVPETKGRIDGLSHCTENKVLLCDTENDVVLHSDENDVLSIFTSSDGENDDKPYVISEWNSSLGEYSVCSMEFDDIFRKAEEYNQYKHIDISNYEEPIHYYPNNDYNIHNMLTDTTNDTYIQKMNISPSMEPEMNIAHPVTEQSTSNQLIVAGCSRDTGNIHRKNYIPNYTGTNIKPNRENTAIYTENINRVIPKEIINGFENVSKKCKNIPDSVRIILSYGLKFILPYKKYKVIDIIDMIDNVSDVWDELSEENKIRNINKWKNNLIKVMCDYNNKLNLIDKKIINMLMCLEDFIKSNPNIVIMEADKGKKTITIDKDELDTMTQKFMEEAFLKELYVYRGTFNEKEILIMRNKTKAILYRNISKWKEHGIFVIRNECNLGKEKWFWDTMRNVDNEIPKMIFTVKTHKDILGVRNICPKNKCISYGVSKAVYSILDIALKNKWTKLKYVDKNIYNVVEWAKGIDGHIIRNNECLVTVDIKEMFNEINVNKLIEFISRNIDESIFNKDTIMDIIRYDIQGANMIQWDGKFYEQCKGVPMGGPSSCIYTKIYMDIFFTLRKDEFDNNGILVLGINVDDILLIVNKDKDWRKVLNNMSKDMELEMKINIEEDNLVEFLDMQIINQKVYNEIGIRRHKKHYVSNRIVSKWTNINSKAKDGILSNHLNRTIDLTSLRYLYDNIQLNIGDILDNGFTLNDVKRIIVSILYKNRDCHLSRLELESPKGNNELIKREKMAILESCLDTINLQMNIIHRENSKKNIKRNTQDINVNDVKQRRINKRKIIRKRKCAKLNLKNDAYTRKDNNKKYIRIPFLNDDKIKYAKDKIKEAIGDKFNSAVTIRKENRLTNIVNYKQTPPRT